MRKLNHPNILKLHEVINYHIKNVIGLRRGLSHLFSIGFSQRRGTF